MVVSESSFGAYVCHRRPGGCGAPPSRALLLLWAQVGLIYSQAQEIKPENEKKREKGKRKKSLGETSLVFCGPGNRVRVSPVSI